MIYLYMTICVVLMTVFAIPARLTWRLYDESYSDKLRESVYLALFIGSMVMALLCGLGALICLIISLISVIGG